MFTLLKRWLLPTWKVKYHRGNKLPRGWAVETDGKNWRFITNDGYRSHTYSSHQKAAQIARETAKEMKERAQRLTVLMK
jgi:hypothetical protein